MTRNKQVSIFLFLLLGILVLIGFSFQNLGNIYTSDEIHYEKAISKGFIENWLERHSIDLSTFLFDSLQEFVTTGDIDTFRKMLDNEDVIALRHFHGPFSFYPFIFAKTIFGQTETTQRGTALFITVVFFCLYIFLPISFFKRQGLLWHLIGALFICFYVQSFALSIRISTHMLYAALTLAALSANAFVLKSNNSKSFYIWILCASAAITSLEYAPLLIIVFALTTLFSPNRIINLSAKELILSYHVLYGLLVAILMCSLCWFAGVWKLKLFISYGEYSYLALLSSGYYRNFANSLLLNSPTAYVSTAIALTGSCIYLFLILAGKIQKNLLPFLLYGTILLLVNLSNNFIYPQFVFSFLPYLMITGCVGLQYAWNKGSVITKSLLILIAVGCAGIGLIRCYEYSNYCLRKNAEQRITLAELAEIIDPNSSLLILGRSNFISRRYLKCGEIKQIPDEKDDIERAIGRIQTKDFDYILLMNDAQSDFRNLDIHNLKVLIDNLYSHAGSQQRMGLYQLKNKR